MSRTTLLLGPVLFQDFEVPASVRFGGRQRLAIHSLPAGGRVVDALGADEGDLSWSGAFSGPDANLRAQTLDELRRAGMPLLCAWADWAYQVIIANFEAQSASPWWVPYRLRLLVLYDISRPPLLFDPAINGVNDLAQAAALGYAPGFNIDAAIATASPSLAGDPVAALNAAGIVAQLAVARGYLLRAGG